MVSLQLNRFYGKELSSRLRADSYFQYMPSPAVAPCSACISTRFSPATQPTRGSLNWRMISLMAPLFSIVLASVKMT